MFESTLLEPERVLGFDPQLGVTALFVLGVIVLIALIGTLGGFFDWLEESGGHHERVREFVQRQYRDRAHRLQRLDEVKASEVEQ